MKETSRNKMITSADTENKSGLGTQVKSWYFPIEKKTVVAETYEEAVAIINKEKSK